MESIFSDERATIGLSNASSTSTGKVPLCETLLKKSALKCHCGAVIEPLKKCARV